MKFSSDYLGVANELSPKDGRLPVYKKQIKERGWDDTELWNLDVATIKFIVTRLKAYRDISVVETNTKLIDSILSDLDVDWEEYYFPGYDLTKVKRGLQTYIDNMFSFWY